MISNLWATREYLKSSRSMGGTALPYEEPSIITLLAQSSFLLLLNIIGFALDKLISTGLIGQILIGVAWGAPGAAWLSDPFQTVVVQLGYLGLLLLVFEGGLVTSISALWSNLSISVAVATTGICLPICLSFLLLAFSSASRLQCFAAGAALCSTSLGTTFTVLKTGSLASTRLGVVLTSAAMLDDVVGLVLVQVISNLGPAKSSFSATVVIRPAFVSIAFASLVPLFCRFVIKPLSSITKRSSKSETRNRRSGIRQKTEAIFVIYTATLISAVVGAQYAGTSNLFAAYIAGAAISWYDSMLLQDRTSLRGGDPSQCHSADVNASEAKIQDLTTQSRMGVHVTYTHPANAEADHNLASNPSGSTFPGENIQMQALEAGQEDISPAAIQRRQLPSGVRPALTGRRSEELGNSSSGGLDMYHAIYATVVQRILMPLFFASIGFSIPISKLFRLAILWRGILYGVLMAIAKLTCGLWLVRYQRIKKTSSLGDHPGQRLKTEGFGFPFQCPYPGLILGCAMIARGEIGFLISALAESQRVFGIPEDAEQTTELFLVVTWAILLCTIVGPIAVGLLARRVGKLRLQKGNNTEGKEDPLGIWG